MAYSLVWLADTLRAAGLKVAEQPGWRDRGQGDVGPTRGIICHHTAGPRTGNMPSLGVVTNGRPGLGGPLSQLCLGRDGTFYVVAAGHANHAGAGVWQGIVTGNTSFIGIEAENSGQADDPWPDAQTGAYAHGVAAILARIGAPAIMCCGHKEYATPKGRKVDPCFDMDLFRGKVAAILAAGVPPLPPIPAKDAQDRATLRRGDEGAAVSALQVRLGLTASGRFDAPTEAAIRAFQRSHDLTPDGSVGPKTWAALG